MANGVLGTTRCQHHCSPDYSVIELEALWTWYAPFCKHYCTQVKSKDHAKTLFRGTFRVGRGPGGNSELCDLFKDLESNPEAKSSTRQARFWAAGFRHERVSSGLPESVQSQSHRSGALPAPNPWRQSPGEALRRRMAAGLGGPGAVWQVQVSPSASWNGGPSRSVAAARGPGAPASQLASDPIPGGDFVMAEHSCICSDDPLICARKVRILLQIPGASPSIWLVALKVSHRFQHVKPPLQEYYWVWGREPPLSVSLDTFALRLLFHSSHTQSQQACPWFKEPMLPCSLGESVYLLSREKTALEEMH